MSNAQGQANCSLLAVFCGKFADRPRRKSSGRRPYPFPELVSSGRLEVHTLVNPTTDQFHEARKLVQPNILYLQGAQLENEEQLGSLVWGTVDVSAHEILSSLVGSPPLPTIVYLELPYGEKVAHAFQSQGVPYVIYWRAAFSSYAASHFRQALLSVVQSSCSHTWDAFQLAHASFRLYCARNNKGLGDTGQKLNAKLAPHLLGDAPKINIPLPEKDVAEEEDSNPSDSTPSVTIFDEDVEVKVLICGVPCTLDACFLGSLEDGLNALLNIEIRGCKLRNRVSATPPPLLAENFSHGFVTMRCDITTCSSAHISLLVSGSAQTCFDDQLLECQIKHVLIEESRLVHAVASSYGSTSYSPDPRSSASVACGAPIFEVGIRMPRWAVQVLRHLAPELSYRSLVTLGIASIQSTVVASFEKEDADRLLFFCRKDGEDLAVEASPPRFFAFLTRQRSLPNPQYRAVAENGVIKKSSQDIKIERPLIAGSPFSSCTKQKLKSAAFLPIPHSMKHKVLPFRAVSLSDVNNGHQALTTLPAPPPVKHSTVHSAHTTHRKSTSSLRAQSTIPLNPLPMKKHGCNRPPIQLCSEEDFLRDVIEFLILRGHSRLVPQGGISEFPDAVLNAKRLDLYNLYKEVVSRGGFYVGNGINWKGQVFSKMRNHTVTNRMTGVGNTLKRHYETYLLEYELAHDDVDGECCLLCHSSAPGDWVNCGLCGEWAHFGCDRRQGLGTFKDYAKTDGLEYICTNCSVSNHKKKPNKMFNGF